MKFFKSRALAIIVIALTVVMLIGMTWLSMRLYLNIDLIKTPYMLLEGEYSVDGGEFMPYDNEAPIDNHFHTITFKGRIPENILTYYEEISFSTKNLWYKWSTASGEVIMEHKYQTLDEMCEEYFDEASEDFYTDERKQRFIDNMKKMHPLEYDMPGTPGYTSYAFKVSDLKELGIDKDTEMVFEFKNPYEHLPYGFSDLTMFTVSHCSGSNVGTGNYLRLFRDVLPAAGLFIIVSLFGLFFFPVASFILGKIDYKYLTFGVLCFFWGLYMVLQNISGYLPMWITDHAMCPLIDKMTGQFFMISMIVYFRSNLTLPVSRAVAGAMAAGFAAVTAATAILHLTAVADIITIGTYVNFLIAVNTVVMLVMLNMEYGRAKKENMKERMFFILSWIPLVISLVLEIFEHIVGIPGSDFFIYGLLMSIIAQVVRLVFDLRGQYKEAIRYQQMQKELYEAKVSVMVSQIQPHFMYNALTSIAMMCQIDPDTAQEATITFAKYLRGNMDSLKQTKPVPFEQELEHLKKYLYIEKLRFGKKLNIEYDIQATDFVLPQLSIQPLVENAVKHGVGMKKKGGTVTIAARETETAYEVIISDDGVGFETSAERKDDGRSHVGMENTIRRVKDMCGGEIRIESTVGEGTTATVILPKEGQPNENTVS